AYQRAGKPTGVILHSDRGAQYCSSDYQTLLKKCSFVCSVSRKGNCWDNAPMESFWGKMKWEWLYENHYKTREEARASVFEYVEIFYNRQRIHASNKRKILYLSDTTNYYQPTSICIHDCLND
ncbi:integrase core domain-containing protein, partial [Clostridium sp. Mt-5]